MNPATAEFVLDDSQILDVHSRIIRACRKTGLSRADAEDLAQDVWSWLLRERKLSLASSTPWMLAVTQNFLLRYRRRLARCTLRETQAKNQALRLEQETDSVDPELALSLLMLEERLPLLEARLLHDIRLGATWGEAAAKVGVPSGSRDWLRKRLARRLQDAFLPSKRKA